MDNTIWFIISGLFGVIGFFTGLYTSSLIYDQFEKKIQIFVVPEIITQVEELPVGAIPVYKAGKLVFYVMEKKELR